MTSDFPKHWSTIFLGEIEVKGNGSIDPSKHPDEEFDLYSIPAYDAGYPTAALGSEIGSSKKILRPGDVLISRIVPHIQRVWVVGKSCSRRQIGSGEWISYSSEYHDAKFLRYFLLSNRFHKQFLSTVAGIGGSLMRARPSYVAKIKIPLPPIEEQRRIAAILDKADAIRRKHEQALALADNFLRATFLNMFGDPVTNPNSWGVGTIGDCCTKIDGGWSAKNLPRPAAESERGVLKVSAVTSGFYRPDENKVINDHSTGRTLIIPQKGDLLFSRANTRDLVAATCIVDKTRNNVILPDKLWKMNVQRQIATPEYLKFSLSHKELKDRLCRKATGTSGSMLNISKAKLVETPLPIPDLHLQKKFSRIFWNTTKMRKSLTLLNQDNELLLSTLSAIAFRGDL